MSYTSKYTGNEIDELLDKVKSNANTTQKVLWEGNSTNNITSSSGYTTTLELLDSIENFDMLGLYLTVYYTGAAYRYIYREVPVNMLIDFINNTSTDSDDTIPLCWGYGNTTDFFEIQKVSTVNNIVVTANKTNATKIVGIKNNNITATSSTDSIPVGSITAFMGTKASSGYLVCDGAELEISKYSRLAAYFEEQFGTKNYFGGDGTTTFAVPDLRNEFLRGYHNGGEAQLSGEVGAHQDATEHQRVSTYTGNNICADMNSDYTNNYDVNRNRDTDINNDGTSRYWTTTNSTRYAADATDYEQYYAFTSRPTNVAVLYCIKY